MSRPRHTEGEMKRLRNGAEGVWRKNAQGKLVFRITKGADAAYMATLRDAKVAKRAGELSLKDAQARFDRYYGVGQFARGRGRGLMKGKSRRGRRSAATYDRNTPAPLNRTGAYHPRTHDYPGVDDGTRPRKQASPKQRAALARGRQRGREARAARAPVGLAALGVDLQQQGGKQHGAGRMQYGGMQQDGGMQQQGGFWW